LYYVINIFMELGQAWLERQTAYRR
jgi:polar amino acid transport system permease protein